MNKIIITGRLVREPELKTANSGTELCNFTVASDRRRKDPNGEKQADFFDCTAWGKTGVFVNTYFHKGDGITVEGRMESEKWTDRDSNKRISWRIQCDSVEFPISRVNNNGNSASSSAAPASEPSGLHELGDDEGGELPF